MFFQGADVVLHEICHLKYKTHGKNFIKMLSLEKYVVIN